MSWWREISHCKFVVRPDKPKHRNSILQFEGTSCRYLDICLGPWVDSKDGSGPQRDYLYPRRLTQRFDGRNNCPSRLLRMYWVIGVS